MPLFMLLSLIQETAAPAVEAVGDAAGKAAEEPPSNLWMFLALGGIFYFLLIRPQGKERKKRELMLKELEKGDKVMTSSGMYGTIKQISDDTCTLQVADGVLIKFSRQAIQGRVDEAKADSAK